MPQIPLGLKAYKRTDGFVPEVRLVNMYLEKDESGISPDGTLRITRPGLAVRSMFPGPIRGLNLTMPTGEVIAVSGSSAYRSGINIGPIAGVGITPMVATAFVHAIIGEQTLYIYTDTLNAVDIPPDPFTGEPQFAQDVDQLNQYVIVLLTNGRFYWILPGESAIDPLNFATAESSADGGVSIRRIGDEFWIFGGSSIEPWQSTGDPDAPFQRASGRVYERGCLSRDTVKRFDNSVMWVSEDGQVCRGGAVPQVVSDSGLAERIRKRTGDLSAWILPFDGHEFYVLRIVGQGTFAYDAQTQSWCQFASSGYDIWRPAVSTEVGELSLVGDSETGAVWQIDGSGDDAGTPIEWTLTGTVGLMGRTPRNDSLSVGIGCAQDCTVRVRWRDGQDDYPAYYDELGARAPFDVCSLYRLGQPLQPYRSVEFSGLTRVRVAGAVANEGWR